MFAAAEFYRTAATTGVKPIIGIEAYLAPGSRLHKQAVFWSEQRDRKSTDEGGDDEGGRDVGGRGAYTHMTMLAETPTGLRNLFRMSSLASFEGYYRKPRMDKQLLAQHGAGIIATTGCLGGEVSTRLRLGQEREAIAAAGEFQDIFGRENFFLEVMDHGVAAERALRSRLLDLGKKLNLQPLATNDSHYVTADQAGTHAALLCVQSKKTLDDPTRFAFQGQGYHLKSPQEMRDYWDRELPGAADATLLVAERVGDYSEVFAEVDRMPRVPLRDGMTEDDLLRWEVEQFTADRFPLGLPAAYAERVERELGVIKQMGFAGYFLVVGDLVRWAKGQGIIVGPGRGSATGSLVVYILQITDLDPIEHSLLFERFLNPERVSPPDIDLDFDERRRGEVLRYATDKYGTENVAQVITFGRIKTKAAIKDAARVHFGQPGYAIADKISKALPPAVAAEDISLTGITDPEHPRYEEARQVRALIDTDPEVARIFHTARGLEGLVRNAGVHACAVILSSQPMLEILPLWARDDGSIITGFDYPSCEDLGLLKMDFLGLRNLTVIGDTLDALRRTYGIDLELTSIPLDDTATFELLARGDTLGVFQLDSAAIRDLLRRMAPTKFGDIAAALALYRPGPMAADAHINYAERSNGRQPVTAIHPELADALEPILGETYHLLVYQEQVMAIAQQLAGYTLGGADLLRRSMGKKKKEILEKEWANFARGMATHGYSREAAQTLWDVMLPFAGYAFNKSHTAGYGMVAYWTAYLKANYPLQYMAALLTSVQDDKDKSAVYLAECRRMGIRVLSPDVNASHLAFHAVDGAIRFGLSAIRNVGEHVAQSIVDTRDHQGLYTSFFDFLEKADLVCCKKNLVESLIKAGAFDSLGHTRLSLMQVHADAVDAVTGLKKQEAVGQFDLFAAADAGAEASPLAHLTLEDREWPRKQLLALERDMLGLYVSGHPLDGAEHILRRWAPRPIATLIDDAPADGEVTISGMIAIVERRVNKKGDTWAIVTLEDLDASIEVLFFHRAYELLRDELIEDSVVLIKGRINWREDRMSVVAGAIAQLDASADTVPAPRRPAPPTGPPVMMLRAESTALTPQLLTCLKETLAAHKGDTLVRLTLVSGDREVVFAVDKFPVEPSPQLRTALRALGGLSFSS
jgi:DNA polymerase-3 subunit alpha